jgi:hypothetical protein
LEDPAPSDIFIAKRREAYAFPALSFFFIGRHTEIAFAGHIS